MLIVKGYQAQTTDLTAVEEALQDLQALILTQGRKLYTELLANEIEQLVDDVAFNAVQRPNVPLYDAARQMLDQKVSNATARNYPLPYNLGIQLTVYTYKGNTYIRLNTNNEKLVKALRKAPTGLNDFSLHDDRHDNAEEKKRETVWNEIMETYQDERKPLIRQIFACEGAKPEWKNISSKFHTRNQRAETRIRHQLSNQILNALGMGQQIPPHKLMPYMDEALQYYGMDGIQADVRRMTPQTLQSIITITEELVMRDPASEAEERTF